MSASLKSREINLWPVFAGWEAGAWASLVGATGREAGGEAPVLEVPAIAGFASRVTRTHSGLSSMA
jgi:hypothetical protein